MSIAKSFSSLTGILSVLILTIGVSFGVVLVGQEQDFRNKAAEVKEHKVSICHKTGSDGNPWVQIEVSDKSKEQHLSHGDIDGNCPTPEKDKDKDKDKPNENKGGEGTGGSSSGVNLANNVTVNNQVASSEVRVETKYVYYSTQFDIYVKFQGVDTKKEDKFVRVTFRNGEEELHVYNKVKVIANSKGIYHGVITEVRPGTYDVSIKGENTLQRVFKGISLKKGKNTYDASGKVLLAGDFNKDNVLNSVDTAEFLSYLTEDLNPVTPENKIFDVDANGLLEEADLEIFLGNLEDAKKDFLEGEN